MILAVGGWSGPEPSGCVEAYDHRADKWTDVTNLIYGAMVLISLFQITKSLETNLVSVIQ